VTELLTKKLSAEDAVAANDADTACKTYEDVTALLAQEAVPNRDPVMFGEFNDPVILTEPVKV
jgi:hypothetical protein